MEKHFICLANSYKHGGRCIAGVEAEYDGRRWIIRRDKDGMPVWIRPVSKWSTTEEIDNSIATGIHVLDVVRLTDVTPVPRGAQTENVFFSSMSATEKHFSPRIAVLERLKNDNLDFLFYNADQKVTPEYYQRVGDYSIVLIRTENTIVYCDKTNLERPKYRVNFQFKNHVYDLPITDPVYLNELKEGKKAEGDKGTIYIACSLGIEHEGMHYKLAACLIEPMDQEKEIPKADDTNWFEQYEQEMSKLIQQQYELETKIKVLRLKLLKEMEKRKVNSKESSLLTVN